MATTPHDTLAAVRSDGMLFVPAFLERLARRDPLEGTTPADYHLGPGEKIHDRIAASWARLLGAWKHFRQSVDRLPKDDAGTTLTRNAFLFPLLQELGFGTPQPARALDLNGKTYAISHAWAPRVLIHLLGWHTGLDARSPGKRGAAAASPHGLVQDALNRSPEHLWAIVSNGRELRLLRDNRAFSRAAYVSFDLEHIFDGKRLHDFTALWLLAHASRFEGVADKDTWIERWQERAREEGVDALDRLRDGVVRALTALGRGFLAVPGNAALHEALRSGALDRKGYYRELLRLVYRLIFLFVAEDRGLLLDPKAPEAARDLYKDWYSTARLRRLAQKRRGRGPHTDGWAHIRLVMRALQHGDPRLALPALDSFLWRAETLAHLDACEIRNEHLLAALDALCTVHEGKRRMPVNWSTVRADELGSVYEGLMELQPDVLRSAEGDLDADFVLLAVTGNERKTTGSYYTPTVLVESLLDTALDPVLARALTEADPVAAIEAIKVCDPACGSGHFLVAAGRRIAKAHARALLHEEEPSPEAERHSFRRVVGRCLYGVDRNDMAVELCKVSLWMEALEPGVPLSFLDAHVRYGNSLVGTVPGIMAGGIPDAAFEAIEGDDKEVARKLKKRHATELAELAGPQGALPGTFFPSEPSANDFALASEARAIDALDDSALDLSLAKEARFRAWEDSAAMLRAQRKADAWTAAFLWEKTKENAGAAITARTWARLAEDPLAMEPATRDVVDGLRAQYAFFHWDLAFPEVFARGGFDVVLGNPPWERIKLQQKEFFATRNPAIANAETADAREKLIRRLANDPEGKVLFAEWSAELRKAEGEVAFVRSSGRYPRTRAGDVNTYALFAEHNDRIVTAEGYVSCVLPTGIATDDSTKVFFGSLVREDRLVSVFGFENEGKIFPKVHHAFKFALFSYRGAAAPRATPRFIFYARGIEELDDPERCFTLSAQDLLQVNPNTGTCPIFRTRRDAALNAAIYARVPVLIRETGEIAMSPWEVSFLRMLDMANSSGAFIPQEIFSEIDATLVGNRQVLAGEVALPLYEAKMVHHYDHRFGTYEGQTAAQAKQGKLPEFTPADHVDPNRMVQPYFWVRESIVEKRLAGVSDRRWLLGWRDICRSTDSRTIISAVIPRVAVGDKYLLLFPGVGPTHALVALLSSFVFDYLCRQKHGGTSLKYYLVKQLPVLPPSRFSDPTPWSPGERLADWIRPRVLELIYTAWDLEGFGHDQRWWGPPFVWDDARRTTLLVELDAAMFHLYGFSRDDIEWVMESFPVIKRDDVKEHGDYRTLIRIRETWDAMAAAAQTGEPWVSSLNPPPASPDCAHDPATRPGAPKHAELALARLLDADGRRAHGPPPTPVWFLDRLPHTAGDALAVARRDDPDLEHLDTWIRRQAPAVFARVLPAAGLLTAVTMRDALESTAQSMGDALAAMRALLRTAGAAGAELLFSAEHHGPHTARFTAASQSVARWINRGHDLVTVEPNHLREEALADWSLLDEARVARARWLAAVYDDAVARGLDVDPLMHTKVREAASAGARFAALAAEWFDGTGALAHAQQRTAHPAFGALVAMGDAARTEILRELEAKTTRRWWPVLRAITGTAPTVREHDVGDVTAESKAWLALALKEGWR